MSIIIPTSILRFTTLKKYKFKGKIIHNIAEKSLHRFLNFIHLWGDWFCTNETHTQKFFFKLQNKTLLYGAFTVRKLEFNLTRKLAFVKYQLH